MEPTHALIESCIAGNRKGQEALYKVLLNPFMRICMRYKLPKEDADALFNLAFVKVIQKINTYDLQQEFMPWSKRIMVNTIIDELRKIKKRNQVFLQSDFSEDWETAKLAINSVDEEMRVQDIQNIMNTLPHKLLLVFNMYAIEGYAHNEISTILGISERSSRRFLKSARDILREKLQGVVEYSNAV